jgi:hypothetical protein
MKTNSNTENLEILPNVSSETILVSSQTEKELKRGNPLKSANVWGALHKIWIGGSLVILALGFATLGILSLTNSYQQAEINGMSNTLLMLSSTISMLFSATFLVIAYLYWNRPRAQRRPEVAK